MVAEVRLASLDGSFWGRQRALPYLVRGHPLVQSRPGVVVVGTPDLRLMCAQLEPVCMSSWTLRAWCQWYTPWRPEP